MDNYRGGDVNIKTFTIHAPAGDLNAIQHVMSISIFESIFAPCIVAEIIMRESKSLLNLLPIQGEEFITLEWETPGRETRKLELQNVSITDGVPNDINRMKSYVLRATSSEAFTNKSLFVQKSYNTTVSSIVSDLLKNELKTKKKVTVQDTKGSQKIILSNMRVYDAIRMLQKRAVSTNDKSSIFMFFESKIGLNFTTLEKMLADGQELDQIFTNDPTNNADTDNVGFRNFLQFEAPKHFMTIDKIAEGALKTRVKTFDFRTLDYKKIDKEFDASQLKGADGSYKPLTTSKLKDQYGSTPGLHLFVPQDSFYPKTNLEDMLPIMHGALSEYSQSSVKGYILGDSTLSVGMKINTNIRDATGADSAKDQDARLSGKYLITKIRHIIGPMDEGTRYTCSFEALKGGMYK